MFAFLLKPYFDREPCSHATSPKVSEHLQLVSKPRRLTPRELEEQFIQQMVEAFHTMPLEKEVISGVIEPNLARGAIRAYVLRTHSHSFMGSCRATTSVGSEAHLTAHSSPALTGTTLYAPTPNLPHPAQGKLWKSSSVSEPTPPGLRLLKFTDFEVIRCLGKGSYGQVYLVRDSPTGQYFAMKVIENTRLPSEKYGRIFEEQRIGRTLADAQWSLGIEGSFHDSRNFYILSKYYPEGDLRRGVSEDSEFFARHPFKLIIAELILAIEELHNRRIIHRDIKLENILIDECGHLVLADFGISKSFGVASSDRPWEAYPRWRKRAFAHRSVVSTLYAEDAGDTTCFAGGTPGYSAPEIFSGSYSYEVDVWAAGIVLYILLFGRYPFGIVPHEQNMVEIMQRTKSLRLTFPEEDNKLCPRAKNLVQRMLEKDPRKRITVPEIKMHSFFRSVDWAHVAQRPIRPGHLLTSDSHERATESDVKISAGEPYIPGNALYPWFDYGSPALQQRNEEHHRLDMKQRSLASAEVVSNDPWEAPAEPGISFVLRGWWRNRCQ